MKKICVLGLGYIGLPTALLLAQHHQVIGVDIKDDIIDQLKNNRLPFEEPGLKSLFNKVKKNFIPSSSIQPANVFIIAVPTPLNESLRIAELQYVKQAAETISSVLQKDNLVILESTVPPGVSDHLVLPLLNKTGVTTFSYAYCPERAIPGKTIDEMIHNDRIIGGRDEPSLQMTHDLYATFVKGQIHHTNPLTAEFVKLMENTYRDVNIALANEFAQIVEESNINIWEAIDLANKHPRVDILKPGPGVGGHCIAIDPWFLTETSTKFKLISVARQINDSMPSHVVQRIKKIVGSLSKPTITILGVAYKGNVDDTRLTPALKIIMLAENEGYTVKIHDPHVQTFSYPLLSFDDAVTGSDCLVIITDHDEFKSITPSSLTSSMRTLNVVDTRNCLDHQQWKQAGFHVEVL